MTDEEDTTPILCRACGVPLRVADARFCPQCGARLTDGQRRLVSSSINAPAFMTVASNLCERLEPLPDSWAKALAAQGRLLERRFQLLEPEDAAGRREAIDQLTTWHRHALERLAAGT